MKYRIVKIEKTCSPTVYKPQYKWIFWWGFDYVYTICGIEAIRLNNREVGFHTEEEAINFICQERKDNTTKTIIEVE